jgi:hypothetical protein
MEKSELTLDELNKVTGGAVKQGTVKLFPPTTGPTVPIDPPVVVYRR